MISVRVRLLPYYSILWLHFINSWQHLIKNICHVTLKLVSRYDKFITLQCVFLIIGEQPQYKEQTWGFVWVCATTEISAVDCDALRGESSPSTARWPFPHLHTTSQNYAPSLDSEANAICVGEGKAQGIIPMVNRSSTNYWIQLAGGGFVCLRAALGSRTRVWRRWR